MYANVSGSTDIALLSPGDGVSNAKTIHITNTHASDAVLVDLYISVLSQRGVASITYYILKSYSIPVKRYLNLESDILSFNNNSSTGLGLYIALNAADSEVDVLIK